MSLNTISAGDAAKVYLERGWMPIPVRSAGKQPSGNKWQDSRLKPADIQEAFRSNSNIGLLLGAPSGGLVDVDIDHPMAHRLKHLLPATEMIHGRTGNPASHFWYLTEDEIPATAQFKNPVTGEMIIELRSTGGQTVVPPSRYNNPDSNEKGYFQLDWEKFDLPATVSATTLRQAVARVAALTLLAEHWNRQGSRHVAALALSGMLLRGGFCVEDAETFLETLCDAADDDEVEDRVATVAHTAGKIKAGEPATGTPTLNELFDPKLVAALQKWLDLRRGGCDAIADGANAPPIWDTPMLFDDIVTPEIPASLLPGIFGDYAKSLSEAAEIPEALSSISVLGAISAATTKRFVVSPQDGWMEPVNIYALVGLPPANNKSLVLRSCTKPIDDWESAKRMAMDAEIRQARSKRKNEESHVQSLRAKAAKLADPSKQQLMFAEVVRLENDLTEIPITPLVYLNDVTPETLSTAIYEQNGRIAIISDEGGIMETMSGLYSKGHANYDILLKGIDGGRVRLKRKDRDLDINPYLTMLLVVQPQIIRNMSESKAFQGRGLLERFLYVLPRSRLGYRKLVQAPIPAALTEQYSAGIKYLMDTEPLTDHGVEYPRILRLSEEARETWQRFRQEIEISLRPDGKLAPCLGWGGKIAGFSLRIAGLMHVAEHRITTLSIDTSTMERAITMSRHLIDHALAAFNLMRDDEAADDAQTIYGWIKQNNEGLFRRTDCLRKFHGRFTGKKRFDAALSVLIDRNIISPQRQETTTEGKRATLYYDVNPQLTARE